MRFLHNKIMSFPSASAGRTQGRSILAILASAAIIGCGIIGDRAAASEMASAAITAQSLGGGNFQYNIKLNDTGTTTIGTYWFAWIIGQDYMSVSPTSIVAPANWTDIVTHGGSSDGYAIQYVANSAHLLAAGNSLSGFQFDSTMTPAQMAGNSVFYPTTPVTTAFVYMGGPLGDAGFQFTAPVTTVPEPSSWMLAAAGGLGLLAVASGKYGRQPRLAIGG